jgi:actin related protein 2/3 complex, subunit 2
MLNLSEEKENHVKSLSMILMVRKFLLLSLSNFFFFFPLDVSYKISCQPETPEVVKVNMIIKSAANLKKSGSDQLLAHHFPGMETRPDAGYDLALEFNCDNLANPEETLNQISQLKRHILGGPIHAAFSALVAKSSPPASSVISFRKTETIYVCPSASKVVVVFFVDFIDHTDQALARVFLQEFVEAQRMVRSAPPVSYSREPPREIASIVTTYNPEGAGFISFAFEDRHIQGEQLEKAVTMLTGFRNYLHYHIKSSKTYLHMRMRKRVAGWLQILNRAVPDTDSEKKTASGKSFVRK